MASGSGAGQSQGTPPVPVVGSLEGPQLASHVGHLALLCPRDHSESAQSRGPLGVQSQVSHVAATSLYWLSLHADAASGTCDKMGTGLLSVWRYQGHHQ